MNQRKRIVEEVGKEAFGVPYVVVAMPILENDQVVGGIAVQQSIDEEADGGSSLNRPLKPLMLPHSKLRRKPEVICHGTRWVMFRRIQILE